MLACSVLEPCGPLGVGGELSVFPGGVVAVVGVAVPPTVVSVIIIALSVLVCLVHVIIIM